MMKHPVKESYKAMEVGAKVIVYTMIMRANTQMSYVGAIIAIDEVGLTVETTAGKTFFPWTSIERVSL
jgi:hypothetical protein